LALLTKKGLQPEIPQEGCRITNRRLTVIPKILDPVFQHPLKKEVQKRGITLWMLRDALNGRPSEFKLSRMLNGIEPMPHIIESEIKECILIRDQIMEARQKRSTEGE
jgi:hypothetical protein